jgi:hypothetical protein
VRVFVVRERVGGRGVAEVKLDYQPFAKELVLQNVLGIANAPVDKALRAFASDLAERYNEAMAEMQADAK